MGCVLFFLAQFYRGTRELLAEIGNCLLDRNELGALCTVGPSVALERMGC